MLGSILASESGYSNLGIFKTPLRKSKAQTDQNHSAWAGRSESVNNLSGQKSYRQFIENLKSYFKIGHEDRIPSSVCKMPKMFWTCQQSHIFQCFVHSRLLKLWKNPDWSFCYTVTYVAYSLPSCIPSLNS